MLRTPSDDLSALFADAHDHAGAWEFYALVRSIEQIARDDPRIGTALDPGDEVVELAHEPDVAFPRTTVAGFDTDRRHRPRLRSRHFGLTGPMGPMPFHMTEIAMLERSGSATRPFGDFLDLISGRMLQAHYRAWANGNPCAQADRPEDDDFARQLGAASGVVSLRFVSGTERGEVEAPGFGDWRRLAYGGHLSALRSASAVGDVLSHVLGQRVAVEEAVGRWRTIPTEARTRIGRTGAHDQLGTGATLGGRFFAVDWDVGLRVRVRSMAELDDLLPDGERHALLVEAAEAVLPAHLEWHARLEIDEAAIEPARLGSARLGLAGWIGPSGLGGVRSDVRLGRRTGKGLVEGMTA